MPHVVLVVGPTGSGRSTAVGALRELGFAGIDTTADQPVRELLHGAQLPDRIALVIDASQGQRLEALPSDMRRARAAGWRVDLIHLDATLRTLLRRAIHTGARPHLADYGMVELGFDLERDRLRPLRDLATVRIDTTGLEPGQLADAIREAFGSRRLEG